MIHFPNQLLPPIDDILALADITSEVIDIIVSEWENNPPDNQFKLILSAETNTDSADLEFIWDKKSQRYRYKDSGKYVGREAVQNLTRKAIAQSENTIAKVSKKMISGDIKVADWEKEVAKELRKIHSSQYLLGIGGHKNMTNIDYGVLGGEIKHELKYLRKFAQELTTKGMSEGQFNHRLTMYLEASTGTYEKARIKSHRRAGYRWEKRIRTKRESCIPCISYAQMGWQPIGSLPNPTENCTCRSNCGCYKRFSKEVVKPKDSLLKQSWGWL